MNQIKFVFFSYLFFRWDALFLMYGAFVVYFFVFFFSMEPESSISDVRRFRRWSVFISVHATVLRV